MQKIITKKYSCFAFGEGKKDKDFLIELFELEKFKYYTQNWFFNYGNASGSSAKMVLEKCQRESSGREYDLTLCFVDLDNLKSNYSKTWEEEKEKLEKYYINFGIKIIWQLDNAEDEYKKVLGDQSKNKHRLNKLAKYKIEEFINSDFWKRILDPIKEKERELENEKNK